MLLSTFIIRVSYYTLALVEIKYNLAWDEAAKLGKYKTERSILMWSLNLIWQMYSSELDCLDRHYSLSLRSFLWVDQWIGLYLGVLSSQSEGTEHFFTSKSNSPLLTLMSNVVAEIVAEWGRRVASMWVFAEPLNTMGAAMWWHSQSVTHLHRLVLGVTRCLATVPTTKHFIGHTQPHDSTETQRILDSWMSCLHQSYNLSC